MAFDTPAFLFVFLPAALLVFRLTPDRLRFPLLLAISLFYYLWIEPAWFIVLIALVIVNYLLAFWIGKARNQPEKARLLLGIGLLIDVGQLLIFRNFTQVVEIADRLAGLLHLPDELTARLTEIHTAGAAGLSFITFVLVAYILDCYFRRIDPERDPFKLLFHVFFFPKVLAGPITRYADTSSQTHQLQPAISKGVRRFIIGLAKKVLIAGPISLIANSIFSNQPEHLTLPLAWLGILSFAVQIYFDFSGYTDIAIGLGQFFGLKLPENFNFPYTAQSITDFWRRWHMTLSGWFRDYVHMPLEFATRRSRFRGWKYLNVLIVFALTGLWHGTTWTFLVWGLLHGSVIAVELALGKWLKSVPPVIRHGYTLLVILVGWVFFRSDSFVYALCYLAAMVGLNNPANAAPMLSLYMTPATLGLLVLGFAISIPWPAELWKHIGATVKSRLPVKLITAVAYVPDIALLLVFLLSLLGVAGSTYQGFIYFRF